MEHLLIKKIFRQQKSDENNDKRDRIEKVKSNILGFLCCIKSYQNAISNLSHNLCMSQVHVYKNNPRISILQVNNPPLQHGLEAGLPYIDKSEIHF